MEQIRYTVDGMSCAHCERAIRAELERVPGVEAAAIDLATKAVTVMGHDLDDGALQSAIADAGYEAVR